MIPKISVLIFPAGEINSVELHDALSACVNISLYGASSVDRHGEFVFRNYISGVPNINEPHFIDEFNRIIIDNRIDVIISTHDDIALFFARNKELLKARVLTVDKETVEICRDKKKTYEMFADCWFCPKTYDVLTVFPAFIKPRKGQGGVGAKLVMSEDDVLMNVGLHEYIICEYLPGDELTIDCFTNKDGELQAVLPRSRQRTFGGVSVRARNEPLTSEIRDIAVTINARLRFLGLWYFQIKRDNSGEFKLLEISARCAGTMCLSRALGVNLPLLSVYAAMGLRTEVMANKFNLEVDRTLISRYKTDMDYDCVYIDLDDTVIIDNKVNLKAIQFLYQCVNEKKHVVLITRHSEYHDDSTIKALRRHRIPSDLFDEIIELDANNPKYTKINPIDAIFIDNAFAERKGVHEKLNVPVFDVDGIEVLLNWRT